MPDPAETLPTPGYEAKAAELPMWRERFRLEVLEQLTAIGKTICREFGLSHDPLKLERMSTPERETEFFALKLYEPPADNPLIEVRVEFFDQSEQPRKEGGKPPGRWVDEIHVSLFEPGSKLRELQSLKFICYQGTFGKDRPNGSLAFWPQITNGALAITFPSASAA